MDMYKLKIKEYRTSKNLTQKQLAMLVGISQNYLSEIETGKHDIGLTLLCKIAEVLELCPKELIVCKNKGCNDCNYNEDWE